MTPHASVVIGHATGLHARPAVKLTKLAKTFADAVELALAVEGPWIDAKSVVRVMGLKAPQGAVLHIRAADPAAVAALVGLIERDFVDGAG